MSTSVLLFVFILAGVAGIAIAVWLQLRESSRRDIVERTLGVSPDLEVRRAVRRGLTTDRDGSLRNRVLKKAPSVWSENRSVQHRLVQAGHDGAVAPFAYSMIRLASLVLLPLGALLLLPHTSFTKLFVGIAAMAGIGLMLPPFVLLRLVGHRQEKIRRSLPDALDLLVVCVEAGISLDAAILRVAKDLTYVHPELADELLVVSRKTNAGMTREDALRGLWERTGVDEVRGLVASLVQSEKWGSSSSRVLRVSAETLRRKRRQLAERRAATAPLKMLVPMAIFIFPALFVVILGPAVIQIVSGFSQ
ncbi:MAG TPA: type II secretion system F family protein [Gemmatimonadaceae bacterium]|nr:type II secretion system F family protein [Gemmatimonadaceae bacterium]